jgi:hypothetical protein
LVDLGVFLPFVRAFTVAPGCTVIESSLFFH